MRRLQCRWWGQGKYNKLLLHILVVANYLLNQEENHGGVSKDNQGEMGLC